MLPKIDVPVYEVTLPSNKKKVKYRPFTVKEEKLFLMTNESEDIDNTVETIKQVLNNCVLNPDFKVDELPLFDIEYLFLRLRAVSVNELVNLNYRCNNILPPLEGEEEGKKCNQIVEMEINLTEIEPEYTENHTNKIEITDKMGIVMKYPNFSVLKKLAASSSVESIIEMTMECIEYIYDSDNIYYSKDYESEELMEFLNSMQAKDLEKIKTFFDTMPKLKKVADFKCPKCGYEEKIEIEGIQNFFE